MDIAVAQEGKVDSGFFAVFGLIVEVEVEEFVGDMVAAALDDASLGDDVAEERHVAQGRTHHDECRIALCAEALVVAEFLVAEGEAILLGDEREADGAVLSLAAVDAHLVLSRAEAFDGELEGTA